MPMITPKIPLDTSSIRAQVSPVILEKIEAYCHLAGIYDLGYFIEKATEKLLSEDTDWLLYLQQMEEIKKTEESAG